MTKRAAVYMRVSRPEQSIALQIDAAKLLVEQRGWKLVASFADEGISGAKARRPELDKLLEGAHRGRFDVVIVWKGDRLFRSLQHMVATMNNFAAWGVDYVSITESSFDTTTSIGKFLRNFFASLAEYERDLIAERSAAGVAAARRRGAKIGRPRVRIDVDEARSLLDGGLSLRRAAARMKIKVSTLHRALHEGESEA
jgi:DNA invertase Pin-like site-specific DNA recombinase